MSIRMGIVCLVIAAVAQAAEIPVVESMPRPANSITVNCAAGESVQAAVDANPSPVEIAISGICVENVLIRDKDVMLRGTTKPSLDGIRSATLSMPALIVRGPVQGAIENLSFSNSVGLAVSLRGVNVTLTNCLFENNGRIALQVNSGGFVVANGLGFRANGRRPIDVSDAQFFCTGCDIDSGNFFAVLASRGSIVSLLDSTVTGSNGIFAADGGTLADIDCATLPTSHPCSLQVSEVAAQAVGGGTVSLFGAGDFKGQVIAEDRGNVDLLGARQIDAPDVNAVDFFGTISAGALLDVDPPAQSRILSTSAAHFGQVLITEDTILNGSIQCASAADAWLDPTVIPLPGSAVTGCEHAVLPATGR